MRSQSWHLTRRINVPSFRRLPPLHLPTLPQVQSYGMRCLAIARVPPVRDCLQQQPRNRYYEPSPAGQPKHVHCLALPKSATAPLNPDVHNILAVALSASSSLRERMNSDALVCPHRTAEQPANEDAAEWVTMILLCVGMSKPTHPGYSPNAYRVSYLLNSRDCETKLTP